MGYIVHQDGRGDVTAYRSGEYGVRYCVDGCGDWCVTALVSSREDLERALIAYGLPAVVDSLREYWESVA